MYSELQDQLHTLTKERDASRQHAQAADTQVRLLFGEHLLSWSHRAAVASQEYLTTQLCSQAHCLYVS